MKTAKHIVIVLLIIFISESVINYLKVDDYIFMIFLLTVAIFVIVNLMLRNSLSFKKYFTSRYNFLTSKIKRQKKYDLPRDIMFEKIIEVIKNSNFKLVDTNKEKYEILAITPLTFKSWGENLYINFETKDNTTIMEFCSTTLFQVFSFGKNEKNYDNLLDLIENSLII